MAIPMILILTLPVTSVVIVNRRFNDYYSHGYKYKWWMYIPTSMFAFYTGVILNIVAIPVALLLTPFLLCFGVFEFLRHF